MNFTGNKSCSLAEEISTDVNVIIAHILIVSFDLISFVLLGVYVFIQIESREVHLNFRILRINIVISLLLRNIFTFYRSGRHLISVLTVSLGRLHKVALFKYYYCSPFLCLSQMLKMIEFATENKSAFVSKLLLFEILVSVNFASKNVSNVIP